jgi:hypothetical protein
MTLKKDHSNHDIVEFLFKEKDIARQEVFLNVKAVNQVSIILLPFFFTGVGLLLGYGDFKVDMKKIDGDRLSMILIAISQIMFLLWMYGLSIVSNMAALAGYIKALEEKINYFADEKITQWETTIHEKYILNFRNIWRFKSGQFISTFLWNFSYLILFLWITYYIFNHSLKTYCWFVPLSLVEVVVIFRIFYLSLKSRKECYELTRLPHS